MRHHPHGRVEKESGPSGFIAAYWLRILSASNTLHDIAKVKKSRPTAVAKASQLNSASQLPTNQKGRGCPPKSFSNPTHPFHSTVNAVRHAAIATDSNPTNPVNIAPMKSNFKPKAPSKSTKVMSFSPLAFGCSHCRIHRAIDHR